MFRNLLTLDRFKFQISTADGQKLAKKIRAAKFVECSALTGENLKKIFEDAVAAALQKSTKPKRPCILL